MKVILFGSSGMVGQGVLRECLLDPEVEKVLAVTRRPIGQLPPKVTELVHADFTDFSGAAVALTGYDACFFCLGVSSAGMAEADYRHVTYGFTLAAAEVLSRQNTNMTFIFVSGAGTDRSGQGRSMWARVKGQTENALLALPFKRAYMFRPGIIRPLHGIKSRTRAYRVLYLAMAPLIPLIGALFPESLTTTEAVGRAMLALAKHGSEKTYFGNADINLAAKPSGLAPAPVTS